VSAKPRPELGKRFRHADQHAELLLHLDEELRRQLFRGQLEKPFQAQVFVDDLGAVGTTTAGAEEAFALQHEREEKQEPRGFRRGLGGRIGERQEEILCGEFERPLRVGAGLVGLEHLHPAAGHRRRRREAGCRRLEQIVTQDRERLRVAHQKTGYALPLGEGLTSDKTGGRERLQIHLHAGLFTCRRARR
jgi:hypothetical protein